MDFEKARLEYQKSDDSTRITLGEKMEECKEKAMEIDRECKEKAMKNKEVKVLFVQNMLVALGRLRSRAR